MRRQIDLAVVHDQRLRSNLRTPDSSDGPVDGLGLHQHPARNTVLGPGRLPRPALRNRPGTVCLIEDGNRVDGLRRHRSHPQTDDAAGVPVHRDGQLRLHPPQRHRVEREHVQPRGVHQHVLARTRGPQLSVDPLRPVRDVPVALSAQPEKRMAPFQLLHPAVGRRLRRYRHLDQFELGLETGLDLFEHHLHRGRDSSSYSFSTSTAVSTHLGSALLSPPSACAAFDTSPASPTSR